MSAANCAGLPKRLRAEKERLNTMKLYLITGFLGAGKTTFLKNFARLFAGQRLRLIVNEFGSAGVDGALLRELDAVLNEINNGSIFCACRLDQFEAALAQAIADAPDVVLVEASGLADPTNVRRVLNGFPAVSYGGSICVADAARLVKVFSTAQACPRQLAVSSLVLLNKTDLAAEAQCAQAEALILRANPAAHIRRTQFGRFEPEWLSLLTPNVDVDAALDRPDITLQKTVLRVSPAMPLTALQKCLAQLAGDTWRIKGFVRVPEGVFYADCTGPDIHLTPWPGEADNLLVLLAGKGMPLRRAAKDAVQWYGEFLEALPQDSAQENSNR